MEPNNFENNIQQKLYGLKIPPSDTVWDNVEKKITKKKKDRRIVFILFFLVLFLLSGGYWFFNSTKNNSQLQNNQLSNVLKKDSKARLNGSFGQATNNKDSSSTHTTNPSGIIPGNAESDNKSEENGKIRSKIIQNKKTERTINEKQKNKSAIVGFIGNDKIIASSQDEKKSNKKSIDIEKENKTIDQNNLAEKNTGTDDAKEKNSNSDFDVHAENKINSDTLLKIKEEKLVVKNDSSAKKIINNRQKHKWTFGITFSGGASMIVENPLGTDKANYASVQSTPGMGNNPPVYLPSKINSSVAFIGGVFIEKNISPKTKISLGISFKYFSLINKVGNKIDPVSVPSQYFLSSDNFYSSSNTQNSYRNNFHFLEIPVSLKFQLNKNKRLPLFWHAGINISQLISSNALQFQSSSGLYYNDNSLFKKTQFGLSTGISATLFSKQKVPVTIGPYFYYSPSRLAGKELYQDKHFSFIGIRAEILFPKK